MQARQSSFAPAGRRGGPAGLIVLLVLGLASVGYGKGVPRPMPKPSVATWREKATTALARRDFAEARKVLDDSYRQAPDPGKLFLMATVAQAEGRTQESLDLFRRFLADPGAAPASAESKSTAEQALGGPRPPSGEVVVEGDRGSLVSVEGHPVGVLPLPTPLWLSPGTHKISVAQGTRRQEEQYKVLASRHAELRFNLSSDVVVATLHPAALLLVLPTGNDGPKGSPLPLLAEEITALEQGAQTALSAQKLGVQTQSAALLAAPQVADCLAEKRCQQTLSQENQATWLMLLSVAATQHWRSGRDLKLHLEAFDLSIAEPAATAENTCEGCTPAKATELATALFAQVAAEALRRPRATLIVQSVPDGADVHLGGRLLGRTPLKRPVWAGTYPLVVSKRGFSPHQREVTINPGQKQTLEVTLLLGTLGDATDVQRANPPQRAEDKAPAQEQRPRWRIVVGASSVVIGAVTIGFGISALAVNNHCVSGLSDATAKCTQIYDTIAPGAALSSIGGVAMLAGTLLLAWPG